MALDQHGVVEVAGGFAVDGDDGEIAEIAAAGDEFEIKMGNFAGFVEDEVGKDAGRVGVGQSVISTSTTRPSRLS
jgi:hypothetical protein